MCSLAIVLLSACEPYSHIKDIIPTDERDSAPKERVDLSHIPNAVPKYERRTIAGNKTPYKVMGKVYHVLDEPLDYVATGLASWYGVKFHGNRTSNGEIYDMYAMTAAHATLPIPCYVKVTNLNNQRSIVVRVNDRGPFHPGRVIDLTYAGAFKLGYLDKGTAPVRVEYIDVDPTQPLLQQVASGSLHNVSVLEASQVMEADEAIENRKGNNLASSPVNMLANNKVGALQTASATQAFLQVGAFKERVSAEALQVKLSAAIHSPVNIVESEGAELAIFYKVHVGPLANNLAIEDVKETLAAMALSAPLLIYK